MSRGQVRWRPIYEKRDEDGEILDQFSVSEEPALSAEGYRLVWYHSTRKAENDASVRARQVDRALRELAELQQKLGSPRSRYQDRAKVAAAVEAILESRGARGLDHDHDRGAGPRRSITRRDAGGRARRRGISRR